MHLHHINSAQQQSANSHNARKITKWHFKAMSTSVFYHVMALANQAINFVCSDYTTVLHVISALSGVHVKQKMLLQEADVNS